MLDPTALFITNSISRAGIAENLNEYLELAESQERLADDDDRLADFVCTHYAIALGAIDMECLTEEQIADEVHALNAKTLMDLGIGTEDEEPEPEPVIATESIVSTLINKDHVEDLIKWLDARFGPHTYELEQPIGTGDTPIKARESIINAVATFLQGYQYGMITGKRGR